jgi:hypothetical protein
LVSGVLWIWKHRGYAEVKATAYANALNEQMLLNLARLENGHPAYYLAIGAIDDRLTVSSSAGAGDTGTFTDSKTTAPGSSITRLFQSVFWLQRQRNGHAHKQSGISIHSAEQRSCCQTGLAADFHRGVSSALSARLSD